MQLRLHAAAISCIILDMLFNWFVGSNACANFALTWYGTPGLVMATTFVGGVALYMSTPRRHRSKSKYQVLSAEHQAACI